MIIAEFSLSHILLWALLAIVIVVNVPAVSGGVSAINAGKHRLAWTRYGWSYHLNYRHRGSYRTVVDDGIGHAEPMWSERSGFFPWYRVLE